MIPLSSAHVAPGALRGSSRAASRARKVWSRADSGPSLPRKPAQAVGSARWVLVVGGLALAAAGLLGLGSRMDSRLTYELHGARAAAGVIEARRGEATVALSDGSFILAENGAKFSVEVSGRNSALTRLLSGKLHVRVVDGEGSVYRFLAGPYEVRALGAEFDLAWDPGAAALELSMSKGEVRLVETGGTLRSFKAGESVRLK